VINVTSNEILNGKTTPIYATLMLWKRSGETWTKNELLPVKKMTSASDGTVTVKMKGELEKNIQF
jgi:hypothetical protein